MKDIGVKLDADKVREIKTRSRKNETNVALAREFDVSEKCISRIVTGKAWKHIKIEDSPDDKPTVLHMTHNEIIDLKYKFGFDIYKPLYWGSYESYDGVRHVATDGVIAWISKSLHDAARSYASQGIPEFPFYSDQACELDCFELAELMDMPFGKYLKLVDSEFKGTVELRHGDGVTVHLDQKFKVIAERLRLSFYEVAHDPNRVFITRLSIQYETEAGLQATVAVQRKT